MRRTFLSTSLLLLFCLSCAAATLSSGSSPVSYTKADSIAVCRLLTEAPTDASTLWFAHRLLGIPYVAHTLEINDREQLVVNMRQLDCTTLVETVCALVFSVREGRRSWEAFICNLQKLRYRGGIINGYTSRLHYFSDWIEDNSGGNNIVSEIQSPVPPFTSLQTVNVSYMSEHPEAYKALRNDTSLVKTIRLQEEQLSGLKRRFIPKSRIANTKLLRQTVYDGDIIAITCNKPGLDIAHLGFAVWKRDGLHLLNASQIRKQVVLEPMTLNKYLSKHPSFTGIRVLRIDR